jgi:flagellin-like protein
MRRERKKGITPVIAIIILLFITIALAGAAWTYLQGFLLGYTGKSVSVPLEGGVYCTNVSGLGTVRAIATNTGTQPLYAADFVIIEIDGNTAAFSVSTQFPLDPPAPPEPGESGIIIDDNNNNQGWGAGAHTVRMGTGTTAVTKTVYC